MDYIQKIKELRIQNGLSQVELSKRLGLSESTYGLYETYQRHMDIETFANICRLFHASADELLDLS
jgi:transcriptional regulator with XRE-family HTH domain